MLKSWFLTRKKLFFEKGTTLFELLVVILVLSSLAISSTLVIPNQIKKARDAQRKADLEKVKVALYDYYFDEDCFPLSLVDCRQDFRQDNQVYLNQFPCDPTQGKYIYQVEDSSCPQWFKILTNLERNQDSGIKLVGCQAGCGPDCRYNYGLSSTNIKVNEGCVTYYACGPSGECGAYEDPIKSGCPKIFENDSTCGGGCDCGKGKEKCCHDESGKKVPYIEGPTPTPKPTKASSEKGKDKN